MPYFEPSRPMPDSLTPPNGATSVVVQPDRKIVVGGDADGDFALVRFREDGAVDAERHRVRLARNERTPDGALHALDPRLGPVDLLVHASPPPRAPAREAPAAVV